jgi:HD-GYP domain-containing protein (c-di-GMP phosphodiesterase class II)
MQDDKSPDYLPISLSSLKTDTKIGCDIYLLVKTSTESRHILYCGADAVFVSEQSDKLLEKNVSRLFIKKEDQKKYFEYLENNFHDIVSDTRIPADERAKIVHSAATNLIKDLYNDPSTGNVERTKRYAYNMVDYTLKDSKNAESLLKIAVHEYHTYIHSVNVAAVGALFAKNLGFKKSELKSFCSGILLHDISIVRLGFCVVN